MVSLLTAMVVQDAMQAAMEVGLAPHAGGAIDNSNKNSDLPFMRHLTYRPPSAIYPEYVLPAVAVHQERRIHQREHQREDRS